MSDEIDPILEQSLDGVDTREPIIPKGNYPVEILNVEQRTSESGTKMLSVLAKTREDVTDVEGKPVHNGHLLRQTIFLTPNEYSTTEDIQKSLKKFMLGCGVTSGRLTPLEQWKGKTAVARVAIQKPTDKFPDPSNKITGWVS